MQHVLEASKGPLDPATIRAIFREIMSGSRALQKILKVSYLGPEYSFSHLAAVERFGQAVEFMRVGSIAAVFEEVNRGHADFGVVPLENSTDGRVADTLDMFLRLPQLKICAEIRLKIHHNLLANCEQQEIRRVYSKPQALSQCRNWLSKNVPHASLHEVASTAVAAELAQREPGAAAVASRQAAVKYSLRILFQDIEDSPYNETRFAVISHQKCSKSAARTRQPSCSASRTTPEARWRPGNLQAGENQPDLDRIVPHPDGQRQRIRLLRRFRRPRGGSESRQGTESLGGALRRSHRASVRIQWPRRAVAFVWPGLLEIVGNLAKDDR